MLSVITIDMSPEIHVFGATVAWHGLMTAVGIGVGAWLAVRVARREGLDTDQLLTMIAVIAIAGIVGTKLLYLAINHPGDLLVPGHWFRSRGFAFYGALILGPLAAWFWLRRRGLSARYLDMAAVGFSLGTAVGRVGDLISGEHYGPPSNAPWAVRYLNRHAEVPRTGVAYQSGALYEIVLGLVIFAVVWPLRHRIRTPMLLLWLVVGLYGAGRFLMFFSRSDSSGAGLGLNEAQLISVVIMTAAALGALAARRRARRDT